MGCIKPQVLSPLQDLTPSNVTLTHKVSFNPTLILIYCDSDIDRLTKIDKNWLEDVTFMQSILIHES